jgi:hypothetical protein
LPIRCLRCERQKRRESGANGKNSDHRTILFLTVVVGAFAQNLVDNWATNWYGYQRSGAIQIEFACSNKLRHLGPGFGLVLSEGMPGI